MVGDSPDSPPALDGKRRAALILSVLTGETSAQALAREHELAARSLRGRSRSRKSN